MNLQQVFRVAVCAVLFGLLIVGGGLFPAQPVVEKETKSASLNGAAALDQLKRDGQYDSLQAAMNQARFSVSRTENTPVGRAAWHARNPAAGYNAYITESGVSIAVNDRSYVSLNLSSLGYGAELRAVGPGEVYADKQTIYLTRDAGVQEWFVNGPDGLEQGFTLTEPPGARQAGAPLRLALEVSEGWRAMAREDGQQVKLRNAVGQTVEYSKLVVSDSLGRDIPARLAVVDEQVVIEVEDSEATYPLTIDPLFTFQQKLVAADGASGDHFGDSVALDGDTLVVCASMDNIGANVSQGSVYVFTRNGAVWTERQKLTASDGDAGDCFGVSVALSGDTLVVGDISDDIGANTDQGSVYVFTNDGAVWTERQKLTASDGEEGDLFGFSVALDGGALVVGASWDSIGANARQGSAYVFMRNGAVWTEQQKLTAGDGGAYDLFGASVALEGETLVVGAYYDKIGATVGQGSAYVFTHNGAGWTEQQKLTASDGAMNDYFGLSVALSGDTLVVGAPHDSTGANPNQGSVYAFTRSGAVWLMRQKLTTTPDAYKGFGASVALDAGTLVVGAPLEKLGANPLQGSVYVFYRPPCESLALSPVSLPNGSIYSGYYQLVKVNSPGYYQFALSSGAPPPGLSLSSNGALSGTPTTQGAYQFTITATDLTNPCYISRDYTITIDSCIALTIDPPTLPNGWKGSPYFETLTGMFGVSPYTFSKKSGLLPPGLSLSPYGVLSGTPKQTGFFSFTVEVRDTNGCVGTAAYSIAITVPGIEFSRAPGAKRGAR